MPLQITTLVENSKGEHLSLRNEHGIAFYIQYNDHKIVFDTGQSDAFIYNADQLQISLADIDHVVLSHGHYDHSGGVRALTSVARNFTLWMGTGFFEEKYGFRNNSYEYLGNNFNQDYLDEKGIPYHFVHDDLTEIVPGIYIVTNFPRIHSSEMINPRFVKRGESGFVPDPFNDEVSIAVDTPKGLIALLGCSHPGMMNMLDAARNLLGKPIYAVLGGTHLVEAKGECLRESIAYLNNEEMQIVGVSHCTGMKAMSQMSESNGRYFHNRTGSSLFVNV